MAAKNSKSLYVAVLALFCLGVGYLLFSGISESSVYFLNVSEALAMPQDKLQSARLFGTVKGDGIATLEEGSGVRFQLEDKDNGQLTLWVVYRGVVPDTFKQGAEVIVEGGFENAAAGFPAGVAPGEKPARLFKAETLMTKCPSKYQKENRG